MNNISVMTDTPPLVPSDDASAAVTSMSQQQQLRAHAAKDEVDAFSLSSANDSHGAALSATSALENAVNADVSIGEFAEALEASPEAVQAIVDHDIDLEDLYPSRNSE